MKNILAEIVAQKKITVAESKFAAPLEKIQTELQISNFKMSQKFSKGAWNLIAECKLQSPAKGRLNQTHSVLELAKIYQASGAAMLSVHTDKHFLGSNDDFKKIRAEINLPLLRKDFIIDEYQIYEARQLGADAVLLIVRILTPAQLKNFLYKTWSLGMDALVEVHDETDLKIAQDSPANFIGINNRNLKNFTTSIENTLELLPNVDKNRVIITESGIASVDDIKILRDAGCDGALVGEGLVRAENISLQTKLFSEG